MLRRRYEILLPLQYNDGLAPRPTEGPFMPLPFDATLKELVQAYAADWLAVLD